MDRFMANSTTCPVPSRRSRPDSPLENPTDFPEAISGSVQDDLMLALNQPRESMWLFMRDSILHHTYPRENPILGQGFNKDALSSRCARVVQHAQGVFTCGSTGSCQRSGIPRPVNDRVTGKRGRVGRRARPHNGGLLMETMTIDTLLAHGPPPLAAAQLYGVRRRPRRTRTRVRPLAPAPSVSGGAGGTSCPTSLTRPSQLSRTILERSQRAGSDCQFEPGTRGEDTGGSTHGHA